MVAPCGCADSVVYWPETSSPGLPKPSYSARLPEFLAAFCNEPAIAAVKVAMPESPFCTRTITGNWLAAEAAVAQDAASPVALQDAP
jgi:hypothetical protein